MFFLKIITCFIYKILNKSFKVLYFFQWQVELTNKKQRTQHNSMLVCEVNIVMFNKHAKNQTKLQVSLERFKHTCMCT